MSAIDFEYAIKKDVRNNPIVREIDQDRHRQMMHSIWIGIAFVAALLFSAVQNFQVLRHGYNLQDLERERAAEEEINRQLHLKIATLKAPERIQAYAERYLKMVQPTAGQAIVIERVTAAPPPDKSVVAAR